MSTFAVIEIKEISGKQKFYKLSNNNKCEYDDFCNLCKSNLIFKKQLATIQTRLIYVAQLKYDHLDITKFRELEGRKANDTYKDYEVKTKNLRPKSRKRLYQKSFLAMKNMTLQFKTLHPKGETNEMP